MRMGWVVSGVVALAMQLPATGHAGEERINDGNWKHHPAIEKIRALFNEINGAQKAGKLKRDAKKCELYDSAVVINGELYTDHNSIVRKYVVDGGSEDSRARAEYYYNEKGVPRFTYRFRGAFNGTRVEERIYFDESGKQLYLNRTEEGPGYNPSDLADFVADPRADYANLCKE